MRTELLKRGLGAQRRSALVWGGALLLLTISVLAAWPSMRESGSLDALVSGLSPELVSALGMEGYGSPAGFLNGNLYALFLPVLLAALGIMHMSALTAGDEDSGRLELLLALPVSRVGVYLSRFTAVVLVLAAVAALIGSAVGLGALVLDMEVEFSRVLAATSSVFLLALFHTALAIALGGAGLRAAIVLAGSFGVLALGYFAHAILPTIAELETFANVSPWHWALAEQPLETGLDVGGAAILIGSSGVLVASGLIGIRRRTIRTP